MKSRKQTAVTLAIWLLLSLLLAACGKKTDNESAVLQEEVQEQSSENNKKQEEVSDDGAKDKPEETGNKDLVDALKKKYSASEKQEYDGNVIKIDRNESIQIEIGYNPWDREDKVEENFVIYQDAQLQSPVDVGIFDYNTDNGILTIEPPFYGVAEMNGSDDVDLSHLSGNYLFGDDERGWGTLSQYYICLLYTSPSPRD